MLAIWTSAAPGNEVASQLLLGVLGLAGQQPPRGETVRLAKVASGRLCARCLANRLSVWGRVTVARARRPAPCAGLPAKRSAASHSFAPRASARLPCRLRASKGPRREGQRALRQLEAALAGAGRPSDTNETPIGYHSLVQNVWNARRRPPPITATSCMPRNHTAIRPLRFLATTPDTLPFAAPCRCHRRVRQIRPATRPVRLRLRRCASMQPPTPIGRSSWLARAMNSAGSEPQRRPLRLREAPIRLDDAQHQQRLLWAPWHRWMPQPPRRRAQCATARRAAQTREPRQRRSTRPPAGTGRRLVSQPLETTRWSPPRGAGAGAHCRPVNDSGVQSLRPGPLG